MIGAPERVGQPLQRSIRAHQSHTKYAAANECRCSINRGVSAAPPFVPRVCAPRTSEQANRDARGLSPYPKACIFFFSPYQSRKTRERRCRDAPDDGLYSAVVPSQAQDDGMPFSRHVSRCAEARPKRIHYLEKHFLGNKPSFSSPPVRAARNRTLLTTLLLPAPFQGPRRGLTAYYSSAGSRITK